MSPRLHVSAVPAAELERRHDAIRAYLRERKADALVVTASQDYLGGSYRWLTDRPAYHGYGASAVFHANAPMTIIDHGELGGGRTFEFHPEYPGAGRTRNTASFSSAVYTHGYEAALILEELRCKGCRHVAVAGIGAMPHSMAVMLENGGFELTDATDWLDHLKAIKSEAELVAVRDAAAVQDRVFALTLEELRPGLLERDVMAIVQKHATTLGSDQGLVLAGSARFGEAAFMRFPYYQERRIEVGDTLSLLIEVSGRSGYYCELGRMISFGRAPSEITDAVAQSMALQSAVLAATRPGVAARDLAELNDRNLAALRLPAERRLFSHGQGYDLVERPLIRDDETMLMARDMNIACHPAILTPNLFCFVCDNHLVTQTATVPIHQTEQKVFELA